MKVLVTGAGGLIGCRVSSNLYSSGYGVFGIYRTSPLDKKKWNVVVSDLLEFSSIWEIENIKPDVIVHCAAVLPEEFICEKALEVGRLNEIIDDRIIQYCTQEVRCRLIFISSTSVYGDGPLPWSEETEVNPIDPYSQAKIRTENSIRKLKNNTISMRINAPYGEQQKVRTVLKIFIERALLNKDLTYFGSGMRSQDFTHSSDIANAINCAIRKGALNEYPSGVINISSGDPISMKDLAHLVIKCVDGTTSRVIKSEGPDPQENFRAIVDISKAKKFLSWRPEIPLSRGIKQWVEFIKSKK